ncbi:MAG: hypothetical protein ACREFE_19150 [Limisphaerales bacterium]
MVKDVPSVKRVQKMAMKLLPKFGINPADLEKKDNSSKPKFSIVDSEMTFFVKPKFISFIASRGVIFRRSVDGGVFLGAGTGGGGEIEFGDHGKIIRIDITWKNLKRFKSYSVATPEMMIKGIREGKAVQGLIPADVGSIDWAAVKSLTVKKAWLSYYAGDGFAPSDWLMPLVSLWTTIDTGHGNVDAEIECPIIDETKPLKTE